jgi:hypothetical protein
MQTMTTSYTLEFGPNVDGDPGDLEVDTKPKMEKKGVMKRKKKSDSDSDEEVLDNKLEDNPAQVIVL